jgi:hypothetical protein
VIHTVNIIALEDILGKIKQFEGVRDATVVSRSGMHIAGKVPTGTHQETFVAMSAILLGAAETAASELKEDCKDVVVSLTNSKMFIQTAGPKALLVLRTEPYADLSSSADDIKRAAKQIGELL